MVIFDLLQISDDSKNLIVKAHVSNDKYYDDITIKELYIIRGSDYKESKINKEAAIYHRTFSSNKNLDVDGNGYINGVDADLVTNYIANGESSGVDKNKADVNKDGIVNGADVAAINANVPSKVETAKELEIIINCNEVDYIKSFSDDLLFVYVITQGTFGACTPCGRDVYENIAVVYDKNLLYNQGFNYIQELADKCSIPYGFTDFILNYEGFLLFLETGNYLEAIDLYNKIFTKKNTTSRTSNCGCNGKLFI